MMVRPQRFGFNAETAASNAFQKNLEIKDVSNKALSEFDEMVAVMKDKGIEVKVVDDLKDLPDSIFPNNWISQHPNYGLIIYPMLSQLRQAEVNLEVVNELKQELDVSTLIDLRNSRGILEGTGSIIFDHENKCMFACISERSEVKLFNALAEQIGYRAVSFEAHDMMGKAIYHTNVMLSIANDFAVVCSESISDVLERSMLLATLKQMGKEVVDLSFSQMNNFAANCLEVLNDEGQSHLILSKTASDCLSSEQKETIEKYAELLAVEIPTIEQIGGGSARCMLAGFYCPK